MLTRSLATVCHERLRLITRLHSISGIKLARLGPWSIWLCVCVWKFTRTVSEGPRGLKGHVHFHHARCEQKMATLNNWLRILVNCKKMYVLLSLGVAVSIFHVQISVFHWLGSVPPSLWHPNKKTWPFSSLGFMHILNLVVTDQGGKEKLECL